LRFESVKAFIKVEGDLIIKFKFKK